MADKFVDDLLISIHAPLRERQIPFLSKIPILGISIHAPLRERPEHNTEHTENQLISIHAPSRERRQAPGLAGTMSYFNPRSLTGATSALS